MIQVTDFKKGTRIELDGEPFAVEFVTTQSPSARGGATLIKTKVRNIRSGQLFDRVFKAGDRVKEPDFEIRQAQYLYDEGDTFYFMDTSTYEQFLLKRVDIEYELQFLRANDEVRALLFNGHCIAIELPVNVELEVTQTDPGVRGDTVNSVQKPATLETGLVVQVPLFVNVGDRLIVDTREARYLKRAQG